MAVVYTTQYRPASTYETAADRPCGLRWVRDCADAVNNLKAHVLNTKIRSQIFAPPQYTIESNTQECCLAVLAPVFVPQGYSKISWAASYDRTAGASNCVLRLYSLEELWRQSPVMDTAAIVGRYGVDSFECSGNWNIATGQALDIARDDRGLTWLVLTGQNDDATPAYQFVTLDAWPIIG